MPPITAAAALLLPAWLAGCADPPPEPTRSEPPRPNIVLISIDTVRWDHTSLSGYHRDTTPSLRALADLPGSTTFERAYTGAAWSLPAYASMFTGLDAMSHGLGFLHAQLDPAHATLAEVLSAHGYQTAAFSSGPHLHPSTGNQRGFGTYENLVDIGPFAPIVDSALAWLDQAPAEPFFLFAVGYDAHTPYTSPSAFAEIFDPDYDGFLHRSFHSGEDDPCKLRGATRTCMETFPGPTRDGTIDAGDLAHTVAHYDAAVLSADYGLGRLLDGLEDRGLLEDTLLIVLSDHGEGLGEASGRFHHDDQVGDAVFHVPLVIRLPGGQASPRRSDGVVSLTDLTPTVLDYLQMQRPAGAKGPSFLAATGLPSAEEPGERTVIGASLCCYWARSTQWELRGRSDRRAPQDPMTWELLRDGVGLDSKEQEPEVYDRLRAQLAHWPRHPGRDIVREIERGEHDARALRQALRRGGYWAPEEPPPPPEDAP